MSDDRDEQGEDPMGGNQGWNLAQYNVARMVAPIDSAQLADFVAGLDSVNAAAEGSPGYVWRLQTDDGNATDIRVGDDPFYLVNLTVWESLESLREFTYRDDGHRRALQRRREWFETPAEAYLVLWWIPADSVPDVDEAEARLAKIRAHGPTPDAFDFRTPFDPPPRVGSRDW